MANYAKDRAFTDFIHQNLALPQIYTPLHWEPIALDAHHAKYIDMMQGIDYVFQHAGHIKTVQERFRESKYERYADFTIRYRRDRNPHAERHKSEYYKMKADFFTYGITNCSKHELNKCTDFLKYAVVDLRMVYARIDSGDIIICNNKLHTCRIVHNKIECPINHNKDGSSSFFPIEIAMLVQLWGHELVITQKGFI
ncbi:MAG TPA: hypothetical protein PKC76_00805 [Saprospiraceae bacterium]|nr:hypothetical protein [Saprospiraceae bacterium]HMP22632.1 hypothetical protein [Saprospiraceae bacterium]